MGARVLCAHPTPRSGRHVHRLSFLIDRTATTIKITLILADWVPHDHDSSGAASLSLRELETDVVYRI